MTTSLILRTQGLGRSRIFCEGGSGAKEDEQSSRGAEEKGRWERDEGGGRKKCLSISIEHQRRTIVIGDASKQEHEIELTLGFGNIERSLLNMP